MPTLEVKFQKWNSKVDLEFHGMYFFLSINTASRRKCGKHVQYQSVTKYKAFAFHTRMKCLWKNANAFHTRIKHGANERQTRCKRDLTAEQTRPKRICWKHVLPFLACRLAIRARAVNTSPLQLTTLGSVACFSCLGALNAHVVSS